MSALALRVALLIAYDGTWFAGFQSQTNGRAVQDVLEAALGELYGGAVRVRGASRTDAGVHALGQVASFDLASEELARRIPLGRLPLALDRLLPDDLVVLGARAGSDRFDPRQADRKTYRYRILARPAPCPLRRHQVWHIERPLDVQTMAQAAQAAVGRHDFSAFAAAGTTVKGRERDLYAFTVETAPDDEIRIHITASGFLYRMARNLVGTVVEIGRGKRPADSIATLLAEGSRQQAGATAPPQGLCLVEVRYPDELEGPWLRAIAGRR